MTKPAPRLFLDSNVLMRGIVSDWGVDKAVLSICARRICRMILAEDVKVEVERNLMRCALERGYANPDYLLGEYRTLIRLARPESVPRQSRQDILANATLIRHFADISVVLSAIASQPDWLLTNNTEHFTREVAQRTGLRIATPEEFFRAIATA